MLQERIYTPFRLSTDGLQLLASLKEAMGISRTAVLELAIRDMAQRKKNELARVRQRTKVVMSEQGKQ